jgi:hypothetical protein
MRDNRLDMLRSNPHESDEQRGWQNDHSLASKNEQIKNMGHALSPAPHHNARAPVADAYPEAKTPANVGDAQDLPSVDTLA